MPTVAVVVVDMDVQLGPHIIAVYPPSFDIATATLFGTELLSHLLLPMSCNYVPVEDVRFVAPLGETILLNNVRDEEADQTSGGVANNRGAPVQLPSVLPWEESPMGYLTGVGAISSVSSRQSPRGRLTRGVVFLTSFPLLWEPWQEAARAAAKALTASPPVDAATLCMESFAVLNGSTPQGDVALDTVGGRGLQPKLMSLPCCRAVALPPLSYSALLPSASLSDYLTYVGSLKFIATRYSSKLTLLKIVLQLSGAILVTGSCAGQVAQTVAGVALLGLYSPQLLGSAGRSPSLAWGNVCFHSDSALMLDAFHATANGRCVVGTTSPFLKEKWGKAVVVVDSDTLDLQATDSKWKASMIAAEQRKPDNHQFASMMGILVKQGSDEEQFRERITEHSNRLVFSLDEAQNFASGVGGSAEGDRHMRSGIAQLRSAPRTHRQHRSPITEEEDLSNTRYRTCCLVTLLVVFHVVVFIAMFS